MICPTCHQPMLNERPHSHPDKVCGCGKNLCHSKVRGAVHLHGVSREGIVKRRSDDPHHSDGSPLTAACKRPEAETRVNLVVDPEIAEEVREWLEPKCPVHGEDVCGDRTPGCHLRHNAPGKPHFTCGCAKKRGSEEASASGDAQVGVHQISSDPSPPADVAMEGARWFLAQHDCPECGIIQAEYELTSIIRAAIDKEVETLRAEFVRMENAWRAEVEKVRRESYEALNRSNKP